ncbi:hypothetical protein [Paenibacillus sp. FSL L8-0463]|uniref:hypothetical protein n=1 Tax=Paenibacillus sp. FSL L8-0463 TaxID=2954687 RepID=UPI0031195208
MAIATWHRTGQEGLHNGVNHIEYELLDEEGQQIPLDEDHVTSIKKDGLPLVPDDQATLWLKVSNGAGDYLFEVITTDDITYESVLRWEPPEWLELIEEKITLAEGLGIMSVWEPVEGYKEKTEYERIGEIDARLWELVK